jgi:hypothetical protein
MVWHVVGIACYMLLMWKDYLADMPAISGE